MQGRIAPGTLLGDAYARGSADLKQLKGESETLLGATKPPSTPEIPAAVRAAAAANAVKARGQQAQLSAAQWNRLNSSFCGLLLADSLALSSHYEYDAQVIWSAFDGKVPSIGELLHYIRIPAVHPCCSPCSESR